jgi:hypothetical protein
VQLQSSEKTLKSAHDFLSSCPTARYLLVAQPNLNAAHLRSSSAAPNLRKALESSKVQGRLSVAEVTGSLDLRKLAEYIEDACKTKKAIVDQIVLDAVPTSAATAMLEANDENLGIVLDQYNMEDSYTIIYAAGEYADRSGDHKIYQPHF